ncbi:MAG: hypothetical protein ACOCQS_01965 [Bacillota bacterium]
MKTVLNRYFTKNKLYKYLFDNPFILGILAGFISGNLSLGLITTGFTILIWGFDKFTRYIIIFTTLLVALTGNINFEIIFLYFISIYYFIKNTDIWEEVSRNIISITAGIISLSLFPVFRIILGYIPVQILNEINIAGEILLITGIIINTRRCIRLLKYRDSQKFIRFLLIFIMAMMGLAGNWLVILLWVVGLIIINKIKTQQVSVDFSPFILFVILMITALVSGYLLLPLNLIILSLLIIPGSILYINRKKFSLLEMVYLCFILGLIAGRLKILR